MLFDSAVQDGPVLRSCPLATWWYDRSVDMHRVDSAIPSLNICCVYIYIYLYLFIDLWFCLFIYLCINLFIYVFIYLLIHSFIYVFIHLLFMYSFIYLFIYLFINSFICVFFYVYIHLLIYLFILIFIYTIIYIHTYDNASFLSPSPVTPCDSLNTSTRTMHDTELPACVVSPVLPHLWHCGKANLPERSCALPWEQRYGNRASRPVDGSKMTGSLRELH